MDSRIFPSSSEKERPDQAALLDAVEEVGGSSPPSGASAHTQPEQHPATVPTQLAGAPVAGPLWHYVVVRRELTGGALLAQVVHAAEMTGSFHGVNHGKPMPADSRCVVLVATKEQMQALIDATLNRSDVQLAVVTETDGPLAGSTTAVSFLAGSRDEAKPLVGHLRPWRAS